MPPPALIDEQLLAVKCRDVSVALSAGAGCGKTTVLTTRFLSHLDPTGANGTSPVDLRQLIAITFTDAAAREMRSRIRAACYDQLDNPSLSADDHAAWQRLLREIDTARVSTIHAFCTALLRSHAAEASLDPTFGVLEQGEADVLLLDALDEVLRRRLSTSDADTLDLAAEFCALAQLKQRVSLLVDQRHRPAFRRWQCAKGDEPELARQMVEAWHTRYDADAVGFAVQSIREKAPLAEFERLLSVATPSANNKKFPAAIATLREIISRLQSSVAIITDADLIALAEWARVQTVCKKDDWPTVDAFEAYKNACTKIRDVVTKGKLPPWNDEAAIIAATLGLKLLHLAADVADAYQSRKLQLSVLDFDDQLSLAHQLLTDPEQAAVRNALSADLRLLLVDEFQDTDPLQVELIKNICGPGFDEGRLFFVGDFKQSIYRFRGAVPPEFLKLRSQVPEPGQLDLTVNFRSQPGVIDFVNALFRESFENDKPLGAHRKAAYDAPAVEFLWTVPEPDPSGKKADIESARSQEAAAIARRLRQLIDGDSTETPVVDHETKLARRLKAGDVAILFRALSDVRLYEEALRAQGLDYYLVGGHAFYAQQEIFDVLNLLRAVASTADEISLAGILRSPFFALADESLFWLAEHGDGSLNAGLLATEPPHELPSEEQAKVVAARSAIAQLRAIKNKTPVAQLLNTALDLTGYDAVLLTEFLGERKLANLQKLIEHARTADRNNNDLNEYISQLAEFIAQPPKEPLASTSAESADVIRLMTIHRAKGLEFPFVVIPDLDRPPRLDGPDAALDDELGPVLRIPKDDSQEEYATGITLFAARERGEELAERKRLLYVACTRAADYLLLSSSIESLDTPKGDWTKLVAAHFDLQTGDFLGDLPPTFARPRVHIAPPPTAKQSLTRPRGPDLLRMLEDAHNLSAEGAGLIPPLIAEIAPNRAARRQFSFSRLTGRLNRFDATSASSDEASPEDALAPYVDDAPSASAVRTDPSLDARALGLITHDVLARLDFRSPNINAQITEWCEHVAPQFVIKNAPEAAALASSMIARFATSSRGQHLAIADQLQREIEFLLPWPLDNSTGQYFRGYIDCLYQDAAGAWRIVDYKTNEVSPANTNHTVQRYELQLYVYALAAEQALGTSPKELVLELLRPGIEHVIPWNARTRGKAIDMITAALETATAPI